MAKSKVIPKRDVVSEAETVEEMVNALHRRARSSATSAVEDAIKCGDLLIEKKATLEHGEWKPWVEMHCEFSYSTAKLYMKAAKQKDNALPFSSLRSLYGPKAEGEVTEKEAKDKVRETRPTPTQLEADVVALNTGLEAIALPLMSVEQFVDEAGTEFLTKKAGDQLRWLVNLRDTMDNVEGLP